MRDSKRKQTPPRRLQPASYCVTDAQGTILYRINQELAEAGRLGLQHFQALEYLLNSAERLDRLQTMLGQWMLTNLNSSHGTWDSEQQDLVDFAALLEFLAKCHQRPTDLESENLLLLAD